MIGIVPNFIKRQICCATSRQNKQTNPGETSFAMPLQLSLDIMMLLYISVREHCMKEAEHFDRVALWYVGWQN